MLIISIWINKAPLNIMSIFSDNVKVYFEEKGFKLSLPLEELIPLSPSSE